MPFVPQGGPLHSGEFYIPRLGQPRTARTLPASMSRFITRFRAKYDAEIYAPKCLDLSAFGNAGHHVHILARGGASMNTWTFERFAPAWVDCLRITLTGRDITDARLAAYNLRLEEELPKVILQERPLHCCRMVHAPDGLRMAHFLFIPMSSMGEIITHCLLLMIFEGRTTP
jgi:hypothetical protein